MLESGLSGSVRGVPSNGHPYRDPGSFSEVGQRPGQARSCLNSGHAATAAACPYPVKLKRPPT
jgi:hypothetical protein